MYPSPHFTCRKTEVLRGLRAELPVLCYKINERVGDLHQVCLCLAPKTISVMAELHCLQFLALAKQFTARRLKSGWFFSPVTLTPVTSSPPLLTPPLFLSSPAASYLTSWLSSSNSPNPLSMPPISWNGLKHNYDHIPLLLITVPQIPSPVEQSWGLNFSARNWRCSTICPNAPSHSSFLLTLIQTCLIPLCLRQPSLSPSHKCLLCSLDPNPRYQLQAQSKSHLPCGAAPVDPAGSGSPVSNFTAHFIGTLELGLAPCLALFIIMWSDNHIWMHYFS